MEGAKEGREPLCPAPSAEETLLRCRDLASCLRLLRADCLSTGLELLRRIQERLLAILQHSTQVCRAAPALGASEREGREGETDVWAPAQLLGQPAGCGWTLPAQLPGECCRSQPPSRVFAQMLIRITWGALSYFSDVDSVSQEWGPGDWDPLSQGSLRLFPALIH